MPDASRSSGVLTASKVIVANPCNLKSVHITAKANGPDEYILKIFDSKDSTLTGNTELCRFVFNGNVQAENVEADMHGVLAREGLYAQVTAPASPDAGSHFAFSVEFN
mgnify:CR=1 FL=1|jgi:hypothetical protein